MNSKRAEAHRLYVSGEAKTLADAVRAAGYQGRSIYDVAKAEDWKADRDAFQLQLTNDYLRASREEAVKNARKIRADSMEAATLAVASLLERIQSGDLKPGPNGVKQIVDVALDLANASVGDDSQARRALDNHSLADLIRMSAERMMQFTVPQSNRAEPRDN